METFDSLNLNPLDRDELIQISGGEVDYAYEAGRAAGYVAGFLVFGVGAFAFLGAKKFFS